MKVIFIVLFLILTGCKNNSKAQEGVHESVIEMWTNYTESNPEFKNKEFPESFYFHDNKEDANRLGQLVLSGKKSAGSGLYLWFKEANVDLPKVGLKLIVTDFEGKALAIIETKSVDTIPFNKISEKYAAMDMGTNIEPLEKWKKAHWDFFASAMQESGEIPTENMLIVCETYATIWPKNPN